MDLTGACAGDYMHECVCVSVSLCSCSCVCICVCVCVCVCVRARMYGCLSYGIRSACVCLLPLDKNFYFYSAVTISMSNTLCKSGKQ